jgi:hypothetical protein
VPCHITLLDFLLRTFQGLENAGRIVSKDWKKGKAGSAAAGRFYRQPPTAPPCPDAFLLVPPPAPVRLPAARRILQIVDHEGQTLTGDDLVALLRGK